MPIIPVSNPSRLARPAGTSGSKPAGRCFVDSRPPSAIRETAPSTPEEEAAAAVPPEEPARWYGRPMSPGWWWCFVPGSGRGRFRHDEWSCDYHSQRAVNTAAMLDHEGGYMDDAVFTRAPCPPPLPPDLH